MKARSKGRVKSFLLLAFFYEDTIIPFTWQKELGSVAVDFGYDPIYLNRSPWLVWSDHLGCTCRRQGSLGKPRTLRVTLRMRGTAFLRLCKSGRYRMAETGTGSGVSRRVASAPSNSANSFLRCFIPIKN